MFFASTVHEKNGKFRYRVFLYKVIFKKFLALDSYIIIMTLQSPNLRKTCGRHESIMWIHISENDMSDVIFINLKALTEIIFGSKKGRLLLCELQTFINFNFREPFVHMGCAMGM